MSNFKHEHKIRVHYCHTDAGTVVYFANYLTFMEQARQELMLQLGFEFPLFAYTHCEMSIKRPAQLGDLLTITTSIKKVTAVTLEVQHNIFKPESDHAIVQGSLKLAYLSSTGRPQRIPRALREALLAIAESQE